MVLKLRLKQRSNQEVNFEKKTPKRDVLDVKNLDQVHQIFPPLTANGSVDATSYIFQHPDISLCQKSAALCFDNSDIVMLDVLQPQKYTWGKGQHLLWMIKVADWNIVNHLFSPQPVLFKIQKIPAFTISIWLCPPILIWAIGTYLLLTLAKMYFSHLCWSKISGYAAQMNYLSLPGW